MTITIKDTSEGGSLITNDVKFGAGEAGEVYIGGEFEVFVPIIWIGPDGVEVVGVGDEEGIVGVAGAAGVLGGGGGGYKKE